MQAVALAGATAVLYFVAAKLGLSMAFVAAQVTTVWPPTGLAIAVLVVRPQLWPGVFAGALIANATAQEPIATALGIAIGNTLEAAVGAWMLRRVGFRPALDRLRDVLAFLGLGAVAPPALSATIGVASLCLGGVQPWDAFGALWGVWWLGDAMGALVVAPFLLTWGTVPLRRTDAEKIAEAAAMFVGALAVGFGVFAGRLGVPAAGYPLHYTIFPFIVWAALRFRQRATTALAFAVSAIAIWSTLHGWGPFVGPSENASLVMLELFMSVVAVTGLLLAAAIAERDALARRVQADVQYLRVGEARLRLALETGAMGVWDWDVATGRVEWSDNLEALHGLPPGGFPGTFDGFEALVHPEDRVRVRDALARALAGGSGYALDFRNVWPDGSVHWMSTTGTVLRDLDGRARRMIGLSVDMTERRRLEEALTERAEKLAAADQRKDEFLAMLAHELRNPLAPLSTALHLVRIDPTQRERFLDMADRQVKQLVHLVDDLLDVSRITHGKIALRKERVALADVVARAVETARPAIEGRGQKLTVSLPAAPVHLDADPSRLAQVVGNLLGNASKYTQPGGSIWITAERLDEELVLRVRDTGVGLAPDLLPQVFDLFVQGDRSLDRARGGLGIGLTVVRRLVELHGGRVEARSAGLGHGSEFVIRLPVPQTPFATAATEPPPAASPGVPARALRILVVDDNTDSAQGLASVLTLWGHEVRVAFDGLAALELAEAQVPDVILSDIGLPGMDGYALARRLREHPGFGGAVLIALSGYGRDDDRRRALDAGFDHHLVKPPDLAALGELLGRAMTVGEPRPRVLH